MESSVNRWGNSLAVRIPKAFAAEASLEENSPVEIVMDGNRIVIEPAQRKWELSKLLSAVDAGNIHSAVEWGDKRGNEAW